VAVRELLGGLGEECVGLGNECWGRGFDDLQNQKVVDRGVGMHEHIAEAHDLRQVRDRRGRRGIDLGQLVECLADDAELAFDGSPQDCILR